MSILMEDGDFEYLELRNGSALMTTLLPLHLISHLSFCLQILT